MSKIEAKYLRQYAWWQSLFELPFSQDGKGKAHKPSYPPIRQTDIWYWQIS